MLLRRADGRWLLTVRGSGVDDAPGQLGLVGGHVEQPAAGSVGTGGVGILEVTARREASEETGLDLAETTLTYLESEFFLTDTGVGQVTVAFVASAPDGTEPHVGDPDELSEVGWWSVDEVRSDPRCPPWLPALLERAGARFG